MPDTATVVPLALHATVMDQLVEAVSESIQEVDLSDDQREALLRTFQANLRKRMRNMTDLAPTLVAVSSLPTSDADVT